MLEAGDVLVFNTHVWHAGGVNDVLSAAMFMYYDQAPGVTGSGYNYMAKPHETWSQKDGWEEYAIDANKGDPQELFHAPSLDVLPMHIFRLSI